MPIIGTIASSTRQGLVTDLGAMYPLQLVTIGPQTTSSVTFTNIPSTYAHLQVRAFHQEPIDTIALQFNSDTGNNYAWRTLFGDGSGITNTQTASTNMIFIGSNYGANGSFFGATVIDILDYANTNKNKTARSITGTVNNSAFMRVGMYSGIWLNTTAITSVTVRSRTNGNFLRNSQFALYGIKSA